MRRRSLVIAALLLAAVAGCVGAPPATPPTPASPQATTAAPSPSPSTQAPAVMPSPAEVGPRAMLSGKLLDDDGKPVKTGTVEVRCAEDPSLNRELVVQGGAFVYPDAPVGRVLTLTARSERYTPITRVHKVEPFYEASGRDPNRVDFGGEGKSIYYALSRYPEISTVTPANFAKGVTSNPFTMTLTLSHPLDEDNRGRFARMLYLEFQVPGGTETLRVGDTYHDKAATLSWDSAGRVATFRFEAPIATGRGDEAAVRVRFSNDDEPLSWPEFEKSYRLGRGLAPKTADADGSLLYGRVAPFRREAYEDVAPSPRPSPMALWGLTHQTAVAFSFGRDGVAPKLVGATARQGGDDRIELTFDKPMRGFPEKALDGSALQVGNYRITLGDTTKAEGRTRFEKADPAVGGAVTGTVRFHETDPNKVVLLMGSGALRNQTDFKVFVDPAVRDAGGMAVATDANIVQGKVQ